MIREATIQDAKAIQRLIRARADEGKMLQRSINDIYEQLRDFLVCEREGKIIGVAALHVIWEDIAELRSLAVDKQHEGAKVGTHLVEESIKAAKRLGVKQVFALTYVPGFFNKLGFGGIDKQQLPHKIWNECIRCHKYPDCDETAVAKVLEE